jgi:hypothetical protein
LALWQVVLGSNPRDDLWMRNGFFHPMWNFCSLRFHYTVPLLAQASCLAVEGTIVVRSVIIEAD